MKGGQEIIPYDVQLALHIARIRSKGDHGILLRQHHTELAVRAVAAVRAMAAAPKLKTIPLVPIPGGIAAVGALFRGGLFDPGGGNKLVTFPQPLLEIKLPELRNVLSSNVQAEPAEIDAFGIRAPFRIFDAQRLEQPGPQVIN